MITIGIPCYNSASTLKMAIESALAQTVPEKEVIVVDDGSKDTSAVVASAFGDSIRFFRNQHRGGNFARNTVLAEAQGQWIQFLDADDYLEPHKIERQLAEAEGGEIADVLYSPVWEEQVRGTETTRHLMSLDPRRDLFSLWISWQLPQTGSCLWRKDALEEIRGWKNDQPCCQEHELYKRAIEAGLRFQYTPTPGAVYRVWSEDTLCRKDPRMVVRQKTKLLDEMKKWMQERKVWERHHQRLAGQACFEMARTLAKLDLQEAKQYYRERKRAGMIRLEGPAAPLSFQLAHGFLGYGGAEWLARLLRGGRTAAM